MKKNSFDTNIPPSTVAEDNKNVSQVCRGAQDMCPRAKQHISNKYHFFCKKIKNMEIEVKLVDRNEWVHQRSVQAPQQSIDGMVVLGLGNGLHVDERESQVNWIESLM